MSFLIYYLILAIIPIWAQLKVKNTYSKYEKVANASGMTGAEVARMILDENGLYHVKVLEHSGFLSDHYNPINKTVNLSTANYHGRSIAGLLLRRTNADTPFRIKSITGRSVSVTASCLWRISAAMPLGFLF